MFVNTFSFQAPKEDVYSVFNYRQPQAPVQLYQLYLQARAAYRQQEQCRYCMAEDRRESKSSLDVGKYISLHGHTGKHTQLWLVMSKCGEITRTANVTGGGPYVFDSVRYFRCFYPAFKFFYAYNVCYLRLQSSSREHRILFEAWGASFFHAPIYDGPELDCSLCCNFSFDLRIHFQTILCDGCGPVRLRYRTCSVVEDWPWTPTPPSSRYVPIRISITSNSRHRFISWFLAVLIFQLHPTPRLRKGQYQ